jgi:hypothetical protein
VGRPADAGHGGLRPARCLRFRVILERDRDQRKELRVDETVLDSDGNKWSIATNGSRVTLVLIQPIDDQEEPRRLYLDLTADDARKLSAAFGLAADEASS